MRFDDDYNDDNGGLPIIYMALGVSVFVLAVMGIVIFANRDNRSGKSNSNAFATVSPTASIEETAQFTDKLTADDLDIWDMYPVTDESEDKSPDATKGVSEEDAKPTTEVTPVSDDEKYNDGNHFKIEYADGSSEWITIDPSREKNTYDYTNMILNDDKLTYVLDGRAASFLGIDISRYQNEIDFDKVKDSGFSFVMVRVGARGYKSGKITLDENFEDNISKAIEAGLDVGVYFFSQAITPQEAEEEAAVVLEAIKEKPITYPIAFDMEFTPNDTSRVETLSKDERTAITAAFLNKIAEGGYKPMIYGNKEWLVKRIDAGKFPGINVWLADTSSIPDYPYQYSMWQYTTKGTLEGVSGGIDMDICFVDYKAQ